MKNETVREWDQNLAEEMRANGGTFSEIGRYFGVDRTTVHRRIDDGFAQQRREQVVRNRNKREERRALMKESMGTKRAGGVTFSRNTAEIEASWRHHLETMPRDTRNLTSYLMGDPLPGRSALDKLGSATEAGRVLGLIEGNP